ncbi:MAG: hypothetical protein LBP95_14280 [Deltaproteobacteria bacterium]|nr:hypothetical protein [Deltaproteobacteria bacterium]
MKNSFVERPRSFCALGGALLAASALPGVVPVIHAAMGCGGSIYWNQYGSTGYLGAGYCGGLAVPSSNIQESDIVFGGLDRLEEQLKSTVEIMEGELYVVLTGCTPDIIGDDIDSLVRDFASRGVPVVGAQTGGFRGDGRAGYDIVMTALVETFVARRSAKVKNKVNLLGLAPGQDAFFRGSLLQLRSLLEALGLTVNSFFTVKDTLENVRQSGDAELNVVVSEFFGQAAADAYERTHGVPSLRLPPPVGPAATEAFLRAVSERLDMPGRVTEGLLAEEKRRYYAYVERVADAVNDLDWQRNAVVVGDANYAPALTAFLADDLGWLPRLTVVTTPLEEDGEARVQAFINRSRAGELTKVVYETDPSEVARHFWNIAPRRHDGLHRQSFSPAFVLGSHLERQFAADIGADHLTVTAPVGNRVVMSRGYAGFEGGLTLMEDILTVLAFQR